MKCSIPEISWHNREPVLSVDLHPLITNFYKLATGGGDCHVIIWQMSVNDNGSVRQELISDLTRHQRAVNTVRWSPNGQYLATADDDANIIIWHQKTDNIPLLDGETNDKEVWIVWKVLRGHKEDIYDLCWSNDGTKLFSGSVDNTAILWNLNKGKLEQILSDHKGFVQGVAWDPQNQYLATISTDRICRLFDISGKHVKARLHKGVIQVDEEHFLHGKEVKYFHDDTFKSFFRRLQFTPDGSLLIVPSGHFQADDCKKILNATLIFTMDTGWTSPAAVLPIPQQSSTVVRCCPILFELRSEGPEPYIKLPYRMVIAVGTDHDVILYDTQQLAPFARFHQIHYTRLTDLTWSGDGILLIASSTDGFCALITFETDELGVKYVKNESETEENRLEVSVCEEEDVKNGLDVVSKDKENKRASFLEQWANKSTDKPKLVEKNVEKIIPKRITPVSIEEKKTEEQEKSNNTFIKIKLKESDNCDTKKRITPTTICSKTEKSDSESNTNLKIVNLEQNIVTPKANRKSKSDSDNSPSSTKKRKGSLLDYFKKSAEKKKTKVEIPPAVDLTLDESQTANDAWNCEQKTDKIIDENVDDCTEDFKLILDDSTLEQEEAKLQKVDEKEIKPEKVENLSKVPRRVALITLSSPKSKTK